jgi:VanZ family protein
VHGTPHFLAYFSTALLLLLAARTRRQRIYAPVAVVALVFLKVSYPCSSAFIRGSDLLPCS